MNFEDAPCRHPKFGDEATQRAAVVAAARSWIATPYHHNAAVKGAGVDCGRILVEVMAEAGLISRFDPGYYAADWHLHRDEERYLATVEQHCPRVSDDVRSVAERGPDFRPGPGDILMWRIGRTFSHAAIVTDWPRMVHSCASARIVLEIAITESPMIARPVMQFSYWTK